MGAKTRSARSLAVDMDKIHQMNTLLAEVRDAYTTQVAQDQERYLADLEYVRTLRSAAQAFEQDMLRDYWRTPRPLRAPVGDVIKAADISRAWLYQVRERVSRAGELGPETLDQ